MGIHGGRMCGWGMRVCGRKSLGTRLGEGVNTSKQLITVILHASAQVIVSQATLSGVRVWPARLPRLHTYLSEHIWFEKCYCLVWPSFDSKNTRNDEMKVENHEVKWFTSDCNILMIDCFHDNNTVGRHWPSWNLLLLLLRQSANVNSPAPCFGKVASSGGYTFETGLCSKSGESDWCESGCLSARGLSGFSSCWDWGEAEDREDVDVIEECWWNCLPVREGGLRGRDEGGGREE